ncbi:DUF1673 domain-containing protein [Methanosarcina siciliae]|nr:DUF1673 domain-containing protein [Methanosarcina siciliae]
MGEEKPCKNVYEKREGTAKTVCPWRKGGRTISRESRYIKKLMGWCPNAKKPGTEYQIAHENFGVYSQSGNEKSRVLPTPLSKFSRLCTYVLLIDTGFTLAYGLLLARIGVNTGAFLVGLIVCLTISISDWKRQMRRYDTLEKNPVVDNSDKQKLTWIFTAIISLIVFLSYTNRVLNMQLTFSVGAGAVASMWLSYFQILYWESENHKKIYINRRCGKWKTSYLIREK